MFGDAVNSRLATNSHGSSSTTTSSAAKPVTSAATSVVALGAVVAGAAILEAALIPGLAIGGAAVLATRYFPGLGRNLTSLFNTGINRRKMPVRNEKAPAAKILAAIPARLAIKQAVVKTVTYRVIVTTLDFTSNYIVIGEFATAAGLSGFTLVIGPLFYFVHETAWNHFGPPDGSENGRWGKTIVVSIPKSIWPVAEGAKPDRTGVTISRAIAKTITFRTIATAMDFTATYIVVGELATAAILSAFGFVVGPFVYFGHERLWERYGTPVDGKIDQPVGGNRPKETTSQRLATPRAHVP